MTSVEKLILTNQAIIMMALTRIVPEPSRSALSAAGANTQALLEEITAAEEKSVPQN